MRAGLTELIEKCCSSCKEAFSQLCRKTCRALPGNASPWTVLPRERITLLQLQLHQLISEVLVFFFILRDDVVPFLCQVTDMAHVAFHLGIKQTSLRFSTLTNSSETHLARVTLELPSPPRFTG